MIETCININIGLRDILNRSAQKLGLTRNALAHLLFSKVMKEKRLTKPKMFSRIQYQNPDPAKEWTNIGIDLTPEMFERCQDMRKVMKMSVSFILSYAIRTYLEQVISECLSEPMIKNKVKDNYIPFYLIQPIFHDEIEGFIIRWTKQPAPIP